MTFYGGLLLSIVFLVTLLRRLSLATRTGNTTGFILNPLLYLLVTSYFYMVIGSMTAQAGQQTMGFAFRTEASDTATLLCYYYFVVILIAYSLNRDLYLRVLPIELGVIGSIAGLSLLLVVPFSYFILIQYGPGLAALQGNRYAAMTYYIDNFLHTGLYGQLYCVGLLATLLFIFKNQNRRLGFLLFIVVTFPFVTADYLQNGRGTITAIFLCLYLLVSLRTGKIYVMPAVIFLVLIVAFGIIYRIDYQNSSVGDMLLFASSEFFLTRSSLDLIIDTQPVTQFQDLITSCLTKVLPGAIREFFDLNYVSYTDYVKRAMSLSFGLAGNIAAESYFFGGMVFSLISPLIICSFYALIYRWQAFKSLPGFIMTIYIILSTQNMVRTSFYENMALLIGLFMILFSYLLIFGRRIWILEEYDPNEPIHESSAAPSPNP